MRTLAAAGLAVGLGMGMGTTGCLYIPAYAVSPLDRNPLPESGDTRWHEGSTRLEDVLLALGPPEISLQDGRRILFQWGEESGALVFFSPYGSSAAGMVFGSRSALMFEFDDGWVLRRWQRFETGTYERTVGEDPLPLLLRRLEAW